MPICDPPTTQKTSTNDPKTTRICPSTTQKSPRYAVVIEGQGWFVWVSIRPRGGTNRNGIFHEKSKPMLPDPAAPPAAVRQPRDRKVSWQDVLGPAAAIGIAVIVARSINRNASAANAAGQVTSVPPQYLIAVDGMEMEVTEESYRRWVASGKTGKIIPPVATTPTPGTPSAPSPCNVSGAPAAATTLFGKVRQSAPAVDTPIADVD